MSGSSPGSSEFLPKRGSRAMLMFGPKAESATSIPLTPLTRAAPMLVKARNSVPITEPFKRHDVRLKEAPIPIGPTKVVAHEFSSVHAEEATVFVSVSHIHGGNPISFLPRVTVMHSSPKSNCGNNWFTFSSSVNRDIKSSSRASSSKLVSQ